ncbi:sugar-transfer associated ATP-grasp domain-containing protein [Haloferacaceae archaeon DSL9]
MGLNVRRRYLSGRKLRELVETEKGTYAKYDHGPRRRLWLWRHGFLSQSGTIYDLDRTNWRRYLTDYERYAYTKRINGRWSVSLDNKLLFHWMLESYDDHRPTVHGLLHEGTFHPIDALARTRSEGDRTRPAVGAGDRSAVDAADRVPDLLEEAGRLVLKWTRGGGGNNVLLCAWDGGDYVVNGDRRSRAEFERLLATLEEYLVCEHVRQAAFGDRLFAETPNTIRAITMYDETKREAFIPMAIQRMGSERSLPMDNFSKGGLNAEIDVETGRLGAAARLPIAGDLEWHDSHPDSGASVAGERIPGWESIRDRLLEIAASFPHVPYVGWDIIPTDGTGGFKLIEANSYPGVKSLQVHRPLLADSRARRFYRDHDVLHWTRED